MSKPKNPIKSSVPASPFKPLKTKQQKEAEVERKRQEFIKRGKALRKLYGG